MMAENNQIRTELNAQQMAYYIKKTNRNSKNKKYYYYNKCTKWMG